MQNARHAANPPELQKVNNAKGSDNMRETQIDPRMQCLVQRLGELIGSALAQQEQKSQSERSRKN
jgi:hypothetical protein